MDVDSLQILAANPAASRHFGYAESELMAMTFADLVPEATMIGEARRPPGWVATRSQWRVRHRNHASSVAIVGPVVQYGDRPAYYVWSIPILSEPPKGDHGPEMTSFAFAAFHDLKEPLHLVKGYLGLLRPMVVQNPKALDYLDTARNGTERMQALVLNLLEYFRLQTNATRPEPVDLAQALDEACATLRLSISQAEAHIEHGELPTVMADRSQMGRLFQNLVANGIKFHGPAPPHVKVSAERHGDEWVLTVADNGIGIPAAEREKVFVPFHRLHSVDEYPGTGLGLSTCRLIVEAHGGRVWAEEAPGGGTAIKFSLKENGRA